MATVGDPREEYERRMHRVIEAIDRRLAEPLDLAALAAVANFSPYHFHRLFAAWMGETLGDYLRRRRLELAASRLASQPRLPVLQVALAVGFGSGEAFTRAFKARFGRAPSAWRASLRTHSKHDQLLSKNDQANATARQQTAGSSTATREPAMDVKIVTRQPTAIAYLRHTGPYGESVSRFWQQEAVPWLMADGLMNSARYGISHDEPSITDPAQCRYDACAEVAAGYMPSGRALTTTLPGGRYAVLHFNGTAAQVFVAWKRLLGEWLPSSRLQLDGRPCFEHYPVGSTYDAKTGAFECDICIPVAPL